MKWSFLLFSSLFCLQAFAQYPATGNKARLGWQTTGDGLVYRGAIADTSTLDPSGLNNAWMLLDTVNGSLYAYRSKAWQLVSGGGGVSMPFDSVTFNINEGDASEQELKYSAEKGYLQYGGLDSVQIPLLPGIWYVRNDTSVTIPKGTVVRASGTLGASGRIKVKHMIADGSIPAMYVLGIAMHDIASGADGYVMTQGKIRQVNTTAYSEGAVLYADVDTLGGLTQTEPGNGYLKLPIAFVVHSASNGTLAVRVTSGAYMRDLHDAEITSPTSNASLYYNTSEGIWRDTTAAVLTSDTSVFARDFQISGTANRLAMFTGSNAVGNSNMYQDATGNIGVGTTSPLYKLSVAKYTSGTTQGEIVQSIIGNTVYSTVGQWAGLSLGTYADKVGIFAYDGYNNFGRNDLVFAVASGGNTNPVTLTDEKMRILNNGNVGIATSSPTRPLHVAGTTAIRIPVGNFAQRGTSGAGDIRVRNDTANLEFHNGTTWQTVINNSDTSVFARDFQLGGTTNYLQKSTGTGTIGNSKLYENPSGSFAGYVGWNTTTVNNKFQIGSVGSTGYAGNDFVIGNGSQVMAIEQTSTDTRISTNTNFSFMPAGVGATGNVGIGTVSPGYKLSVAKYTSGTTQGEIVQSIIGNTVYSTVGQWAGLSLGTYADKVGIFAYDGYNNFGRNDLVFAVASGGNTNPVTLTDEKMRILNNGNVGIATSSPTRPLHVAGTTAIRIPVGNLAQRGTSDNGDIRVRTDTASMEYYSGAWRTVAPMARVPQSGLANRFSKFDANGLLDTSAVLTQSNGRIGIGVTPTEALQVNGTARATRFILNTFGSQTLSINNYAPSGSPGGNVWIGNGGQSSTWASGEEGSGNVSIGIDALLNNTKGRFNTAIGRSALGNNTIGSYNFGLGFWSLVFNDTGIFNVSCGTEAMFSNTSGSYNTAIGPNALYSNTVGNQNTALGFYAGRYTASGGANQTSSASVYLGGYSKAGASGNFYETVIGYEAVGNGSFTNTIGSSYTTHTVFQYGETLLGYSAAQDKGAFRLQVDGEGYISTGFRVDYLGAFDANTIFQMPNTSTKGAKGYAWNTYSDARIKSNFDTIQNALQAVQALKPVYYDQHDSEVIDGKIKLQDGKTRTVGFIAQDVAPVIPAAVQAGNDTQLWGMDYTKLIPYLTKAIQEQQAQIEALKKEIEALKNK